MSPEPPAVLVTYLEMTAPPAGAARSLPPGAVVVRAGHPTAGFYRFLYGGVGGAWQWTDRLRLDADALAALVCHPDVHVLVLYVDGAPAGYAELDARCAGEVRLVYFGLMPRFIGRGLGPAFLDRALREAWALGPRRVWVDTCTLDHPRALAVYRDAGFVPFREEHRRSPAP